MTSFRKKVYNIVKKIPPGKVLAYGDIARALGKPGAARAVGGALNKNYKKEIPCHRVICLSGKIGGYNRGVCTKISRLRKEKVAVKNGRINPHTFLRGIRPRRMDF